MPSNQRLDTLKWRRSAHVGDNVDIDTIRTSGVYAVTDPPGMPAGDYHMVVMRGFDTDVKEFSVKQIFHSATANASFTRTYNGTAWSAVESFGGGGSSAPAGALGFIDYSSIGGSFPVYHTSPTAYGRLDDIASTAPGRDIFYATPIEIPVDITVTELRLYLANSDATVNAHFGLFESDPATGLPAGPVSGLVTTGVGVNLVGGPVIGPTGLNVDVDAGLYWGCYVGDQACDGDNLAGVPEQGLIGTAGYITISRAPESAGPIGCIRQPVYAFGSWPAAPTVASMEAVNEAFYFAGTRAAPPLVFLRTQRR